MQTEQHRKRRSCGTNLGASTACLLSTPYNCGRRFSVEGGSELCVQQTHTTADGQMRLELKGHGQGKVIHVIVGVSKTDAEARRRPSTRALQTQFC